MMNLIRWTPERWGLDFDWPWRGVLAGFDDPIDNWAPAVDIAENDHNLVIRADLPGVAKDDIDVSVQNDVLVLRGEKKREKEFKADRAASHNNGVLEIVLPKVEEARPRKIAVGAA